MRTSVRHRSRILRSLRTCASLSQSLLAGSLFSVTLLAAQTPPVPQSPTASQGKPHRSAHSVAAHPSAVAAKATPGTVAADPSATSGAFADPDSLLNGTTDPFMVPTEAAPAEAAPAGAAIVGAVPKPLRNPKR